MNTFHSFLRRVLGRETEVEVASRNLLNAQSVMERELVRRFWLSPSERVDDLIDFILESPVYSPSTGPDWSGRGYKSCSGLIRVILDTFGPEVQIAPRTELLDCCPLTYGLQHEGAKRLYEAILTRVPGTSTFKFTPIEL